MDLGWFRSFIDGEIPVPSSDDHSIASSRPENEIDARLAPTLCAADHTVYHDADHPSAILLPVKSR